MAQALLIALSDFQWTLLAVMGLILLGVAYGFFTAEGSGIWPRRYAKRRAGGAAVAPGAEGPAEESGHDQGEHPAWSRGTDGTARGTARQRRKRSQRDSAPPPERAS